MRLFSFLIFSFFFAYLGPHFVLADDLTHVVTVGHGVTAQTNLKQKDSTEVVEVVFSNPSGVLGTVILSKEEASKKNISYELAHQKVIIKSISLAPESKTSTQASVLLDCHTTDTRGGHKVGFKGKLNLDQSKDI